MAERWLGAPIEEAMTILLPGKGDWDTAHLEDCDHGCCDNIHTFFMKTTRATYQVFFDWCPPKKLKYGKPG